MSGTGTILIVEDDRSTRMALIESLQFEGYEVFWAGDGQAGLEAALKRPADLIILDVMLPKVSGYEICDTLRRHGLDMPIIMLTAKGQEYDRIQGLDIGADDYITKPFSMRELLARVKAVFRRERRLRSLDEPIEFGGCRLDLARRTLYRGGMEIALTKTEYELLKCFASRAGRVLTRQALLNAAWGFDYYGTDRTVDRFVTVLRKKIEDDPARPRHIITVHGAGYRFEI